MPNITWGTVLMCLVLACVALQLAWLVNLVLRKTTKLAPSRRITYALFAGFAAAYIIPWVLRWVRT